MCNNKPLEYRNRCNTLGRYAAKVLQHIPLDVIAKEEGITREELLKALEEIKDINPPLYNQIFDY